MLTLPANWKIAAQKRTASLRAFVEISVLPAARLRIDNFASITGTGSTITFLGVSIVEGVGFAAASSNATTAANIIAAFRLLIGDVARFRTITTSTGAVVIEGYAGNVGSDFVVTVSSAGMTDLASTPNYVRLGFADTVFHDVASPTDLTPYPPIVHEIRGLDMEIDPVERGLTLGTVEIEVADDGTIRDLQKRQLLYGRTVRVGMLFEGLDIATEAVYWPALKIKGVQPSTDKSTIVIRAVSKAHRLADRDVENLEFVNQHPMEVAVTLMQAVGMNTTEYDAAVWDPSIDRTQGHYLLSRYRDTIFGCDNAINEPISALDAFNSVLQILGGTARLKEDGSLTYVAYDYNATAVRVFSNGDSVQNLVPCEITNHEDVFDLLYNVVKINYAQSSSLNSGQMVFNASNEQSAAESGGGRDLVIDTDWINPIALMGYYQGFNGADYNWTGAGVSGPPNKLLTAAEVGPTYVGAFTPRQGFCGTRYRYNGSFNSYSVETWANLTPGGGGEPPRFGYHVVFSPDGIVAVALDTCAPYNYDTPDGPNSGALDPVAVGGAVNVIPYELEFTIAATYYNSNSFTGGWNGFGTSAPTITILNDRPYENAAPQNGITIVDITIVSEIARRALERFQFGAARITIKTTIDNYDLELGDVVQLAPNDDLLLSPLVDTATDSVTFEIVAKRCRFFEDNASLEFDLVQLKSAGPAVYNITTVYPPFELPIPLLETNSLVMNDGEDIWTDFDGDATIEAGDDVMYKG